MTNNNIKTKKTLIFGAGGQLGFELMKLFPEPTGIFHNGTDRDFSFDITDFAKLEDLILKKRPDIIINAAALTNVDRCENQRKSAMEINAESVRHITRAASVTKSYLVQVSTDYVFDGTDSMYKETSVPNPINFYGLSKLLGDVSALSYDDSLVVRTSGVFGYKQNYPRFVLSQLREGKEIKAVKSFYSPIHAKLLAEAILELTEFRKTGIINVSGPRISRYDLAVKIADKIGCSKDNIHELDQNEMKWPARRPYDSSLDNTLSRRILDDKFYDIDLNLELLVNQ